MSAPIASLRRFANATALVTLAVTVALAVAGCAETRPSQGSSSNAGSTESEYESSLRARGELCERTAPHNEVAQSNCEIELESAESYAEERFGR